MKLILFSDSGATEQIVNKSMLLNNFRKYAEVIRNARNNREADITIDGKEDLRLLRNNFKK